MTHWSISVVSYQRSRRQLLDQTPDCPQTTSMRLSEKYTILDPKLYTKKLHMSESFSEATFSWYGRDDWRSLWSSKSIKVRVVVVDEVILVLTFFAWKAEVGWTLHDNYNSDHEQLQHCNNFLRRTNTLHGRITLHCIAWKNNTASHCTGGYHCIIV